jgi:hypothetical protein
LISGGGGAVPNLNASDCIIRQEVIEEAPGPEEDPPDVPSVNPIWTNEGQIELINKQMREAGEKLAKGLAERQGYLELELVDWTNKAVESQWIVNTTPLQLPRQIDLTAGSTE